MIRELKSVLAFFLVLTWAHSLSGQAKYSDILDPVAVGENLAEDAVLIDSFGDTTRFKGLKGEWLFLDYWSATCIPCIQEMPHVEALSTSFSETGVRVVMINLDKSDKRWKRGITINKPPAPHYRTDRDVKNAFFALNLVALESEDGSKVLSTLMPQYVLIDPRGEIVDKHMPKPSNKDFHKVLNQYKFNFSQKLNRK